MERLRPARQAGQDLQPADDDLDREEDAPRRRRSRTSVGSSRCVRQATTATRRHDQPDDDRDPAMEDVGRRRRRSAAGTATRPSAASRGRRAPSRSRSRCDPNSSSANVAAAPNAARSVNRWLLRGRRSGPGSPPGRRKTSSADEDHRRGEVRRDRLAAVAEPDGLAPEPRLEPDERDGRQATARGATAGRDGRGRPGPRGRGPRSR